MSPDAFLREFRCLTEAGGGFEQLRGLVLQLGIMGRLVSQDPSEQPVEEQLARIRAERTKPSFRCSTPMQREMVANPFEVPRGWCWASLNDVAVFINGDRSKNYPSKPHQVAEGIPFINAGHLKGGHIDLSEMNYITEERFDLLRSGKVQRGDLLYCLRGSLGKAAIVDGIDRGAIASSLLIVRPVAALCSAKYLLHYLASFLGRAMILRYDNGTAQPNLSAADVAKYAVPLPPLAEQKRIVAKVDQLMALCDDLEAKQTKKRDLATQSTRSALTALTTAETAVELATAWARVMGNFDMAVGRAGDIEELRTTIMGLAIRGALTDARISDGSAGEVLRQLAPNACEPAERIDDEPFPLPPTWAWSHLSDLCSAVHYGFTASADKTCRGVRLLRITDIQNDRVQWDAVPGCQIEPSRLPSYQLSEGDLLIARTGGTIGKTYLVSGLNCTAVFASYLIRAVPVPPIVPAYLKIFAGSHLYWRQLHAGSAGTGQPNVNATTLKSLLVPVPPPAEQKRIVAMVDQMMALCDDLEAKLRKQEETATRLAESLAAAVAG